MSEVQRWNINHVLGRVYIDEKSEGGWVTYADHIAYLTDAENALRAEIQQRVDAAVVAARIKERERCWQEFAVPRLGTLNDYHAGVKAARDAVAYLQEVRQMGGLKYALAAIDKVVKP